MKPLRLAILNLSRRPVPTSIAIVAIAISVACAGILLRLNLVSQNRFASLAQGDDALIGAKAGGIEMILGALNGEGDYPGFLPYKLFETLRAQTTVKFEDGASAQPAFIRKITPFVYFGMSGDNRVVGTDETFLQRGHHTWPIDGHWPSAPFELVAGAQVAQERGLHIGDQVQVQAWAGGAPSVRTMNLPIVGILAADHSAWDRLFFASVPTAQQILSQQDLSHSSIWGPLVLNYFLVSLQGEHAFQQLSALINGRTVGEAVLIDRQKERLKALTGTGETLGLFVSVLILALAGLAVMSMLVTRFEAMSLQLAVLRALGYSRATIGRWLLWEGFLLGLIACLLGAALDGLGFPLMRGLLAEALPSPAVVTSSLFYSAPIWVTTIMATTASVFIPLYRVYHQDVNFSLRS